jgi:signal peptidase I
MDLVQEIVDAYPRGYNEVVSVFYYDELQKILPQVTTDQELLAMFSKHIHSKVVRMTITYTEPGDVVPIPEPYTSENSEVLDIPSTPSMACPVIPQAS